MENSSNVDMQWERGGNGTLQSQSLASMSQDLKVSLSEAGELCRTPCWREERSVGC
jgi:hypothetical protein